MAGEGTMWYSFFVAGVFVTETGHNFWLQGIVSLPKFPQNQASYHEFQIAIATYAGQPGYMNIYCLTPLGMVPAPSDENQGEPVGD